MTDTNDRLEEAKALLPGEFERKHFKNVIISLSLFEWFIKEVEKLRKELASWEEDLEEVKDAIEAMEGEFDDD